MNILGKIGAKLSQGKRVVKGMFKKKNKSSEHAAMRLKYGDGAGNRLKNKITERMKPTRSKYKIKVKPKNRTWA